MIRVVLYDAPPLDADDVGPDLELDIATPDDLRSALGAVKEWISAGESEGTVRIYSGERPVEVAVIPGEWGSGDALAYENVRDLIREEVLQARLPGFASRRNRRGRTR